MSAISHSRIPPSNGCCQTEHTARNHFFFLPIARLNTQTQQTDISHNEQTRFVSPPIKNAFVFKFLLTSAGGAPRCTPNVCGAFSESSEIIKKKNVLKPKAHECFFFITYFYVIFIIFLNSNETSKKKKKEWRNIAASAAASPLPHIDNTEKSMNIKLMSH